MHKSVRRLGFIILISTLALGAMYSIFFYQDGPLAEQIFELFSYTITAVVSFYFGQKIGDKKFEEKTEKTEETEEKTETPSEELLSDIPH